jgi:hypothetical protein
MVCSRLRSARQQMARKIMRKGTKEVGTEGWIHEAGLRRLDVVGPPELLASAPRHCRARPGLARAQSGSSNSHNTSTSARYHCGWQATPLAASASSFIAIRIRSRIWALEDPMLLVVYVCPAPSVAAHGRGLRVCGGADSTTRKNSSAFRLETGPLMRGCPPRSLIRFRSPCNGGTIESWAGLWAFGGYILAPITSDIASVRGFGSVLLQLPGGAAFC